MISPVLSATRFTMKIQEADDLSSAAKAEGGELLDELEKWAEKHPPDYYEAVNLIFYLATVLRVKGLMSTEEESKLSERVSPMKKIANDTISEREKGLPEATYGTMARFESWIRWLSFASVDHKDANYRVAILDVFSTPDKMSKEGKITDIDRAEMFQRAFQVIVKNPTFKITDQRLAQFLEQRGFKRLRQLD